jgi:hypothetical protein
MTEKWEDSSFGKSLEYLDPFWAIVCVLDVFHENQRRYRDKVCRIKPNSDTWGAYDEYRNDVHQRACRSWCGRTGLDSTYFPLSVDATTRLFFRIRKRKCDEREKFERLIADELARREDTSRPLFDSLDDES